MIREQRDFLRKQIDTLIRKRLAGEPDVETLWDTPLALILMMLLLTLEWVVRRIIKLA